MVCPRMRYTFVVRIADDREIDVVDVFGHHGTVKKIAKSEYQVFAST